MPSLFVGYGSPYRRDDGVAWHLINALRRHCGRPPLVDDDTGEEDLGHDVDTVMAHQLVPELAPLLSRYKRVIFVDAHTDAIPEGIRLITVQPDAALQATTHHFSPSLLLHLSLAQSGYAPEGFLLSVRGYDFDFGDELSESCRAHMDSALLEAVRLCAGAD